MRVLLNAWFYDVCVELYGKKHMEKYFIRYSEVDY